VTLQEELSAALNAKASATAEDIPPTLVALMRAMVEHAIVSGASLSDFQRMWDAALKPGDGNGAANAETDTPAGVQRCGEEWRFNANKFAVTTVHLAGKHTIVVTRKAPIDMVIELCRSQRPSRD